MRLYGELFGEACDDFWGGRCLFLPLKACYLEGVKALGDFTETLVEACFPRYTICVEGEGLSISKFCDGDLRIDGLVRSVFVKGGGK